MADRAFIRDYNIQAASPEGTFSLLADVIYIRDNGEMATATAAFDFTFANTLNQIQQGILANVRELALQIGYDVSANGSIIAPNLQKV